MTVRIARREFVAAVGGAAAWPLAALAQKQALRVIGTLGSATAESLAPRITALKLGLKETGFLEGQNVLIESLWANDQYDRLPGLVADLIDRKVSVIAAIGGPVAPVAKAATATIPIVFGIGGDPLALGLVPRLNRPGGNITGVTFFTYELLPKQVGILHELMPMERVLGLLVNPRNPRAKADTQAVRAAANILGLDLHVLTAISEDDFDIAFASFAERHTGMLVIAGDPVLTQRFGERAAALATRYAIPTMAGGREFTEAGALMSYGASINDSYRQAGVYVGRILKGERPGDLPVMQPTKFEFIINMKTARALSLAIPPTLLALADEVVE